MTTKTPVKLWTSGGHVRNYRRPDWEWLRGIGFVDVDCHWKWRELAQPVGRKGKRQIALIRG